jgi:hypothetical protein
MKPTKWITWEIPQKFLKEMTDKEAANLGHQLREETDKALEDMLQGIPVSLKLTNLPKKY